MSVRHASSSISLCTLVLFLFLFPVPCCGTCAFHRRRLPPCPRSDPGAQQAGEAFPIHTLGARCPSNAPAEPQERLGNISCILGMFGAHLVSAFVSKKCEGLFAWKHFFGSASLKEGHISPASFPSPVQAICIPVQVSPQRAACLLFTKFMSMCQWCLTPAPQ